MYDSTHAIRDKLADLASRSFKATGTAGNYDLSDPEFLTKFNSEFPLTQDTSWLMLRLPTSTSSLVCSVLRGQTLPTGSWLRLTKSAFAFGLTGCTSAPNASEWTPFSPQCQLATEFRSSQPSLALSVKGAQVEDTKSALAQFRTRFAPSARPSNWLACQTPSIAQTPTNVTGPHWTTN